MKLQFIYWFAYYNFDSPSVRYRAKYPLEFFESNYGIRSHLVIPDYAPKGMLKFIKAYLSALLFRKKNSIIVIQRVRSSFIYSNALKLLVKLRNDNTFYDLDDADYLEYPPHTIYYFIKSCSAVIAGSEEMAKKLSKLNKRIVINTSPTPDKQIFKRKKGSPLTIGWIGDFNGGLRESLITFFFPALKDLPFKTKLVIIGVGRKSKSDFTFLADYFSSFENIMLELPDNIDWNNETAIQQRIVQFDIGIATLLDTELHRSKSGFKAKQYLNNGVPVLSSDIPENNKIIVHGYNGFLCRTPADFRKYLTRINEMDGTAYEQLADNARKSICNFDLQKYCNTIITAYKNPS